MAVLSQKVNFMVALEEGSAHHENTKTIRIHPLNYECLYKILAEIVKPKWSDRFIPILFKYLSSVW